MKVIRYTLISDGSSDRMLMPIIDWLLYRNCSEIAVEASWADLGRLRIPPKTLQNKILMALDLYPCDLLFIHRDAENERYEIRHAEICEELSKLEAPPAVCVIPVRMLEAWFLFEKSAIRKAAGNPNGCNPINFPNVNLLEGLPDPKKVLFDLIKDSSGRSGVRLKKLNLHRCAFLVSKYIDDFSPLRCLLAFQSLEAELATTLMGILAKGTPHKPDPVAMTYSPIYSKEVTFLYLPDYSPIKRRTFHVEHVWYTFSYGIIKDVPNT